MPGRCARFEDQGLGLRIIGFRANIVRGALGTRQPRDGGIVLQVSLSGEAADSLDP